MMSASRVWGVILVIAGILLTVIGAVGLMATSPAQQEAIAAALTTLTPTPEPRATLTPDTSARVGRGPLAVTTLLPSATAAPTSTVALGSVTPIPWTAEEINALSWVCYSEVRGMGRVRVDACLSVISTVRQRYAYANEFDETGIAGTLARPGQFPIEVHYDHPAPDEELRWAVTQYQWGARGSCSGYLYYDSVSGGPSECVILSSNGSWIEFHNGWD
jgi:hypothetical protein